MADKLIFPIGFDLEAAVKEAQGNAPQLLRRLQTTINSKPLAVNLKIPNAGDGSINEIKRRMREIVKEWNALTESERITGKTTGEHSARARELLNEYVRLKGATESYARTLQQIDKAAAKAVREQEKLANGVNKASQAFKNQDGYISRLVKRLAVYAGFQQISNFLTSVREVTAEFELQRVSLGAIIQDQTRANQLFSEIKSFALKSPVSILDLTKYTKQLAAYKIGVDELFETTKKLTDVSVGLGVSMDRVVLAYGQIRARGALYSTEVKQLTEMGIPIVESLAEKLSKANGELVTASQVMDLIEKRAISFELVKEVFDDMTAAGGMFYNMQEKQGNTLYGMWAKLGDAASVMYDEIGNTDSVNSAMKGTIQLLTDLMRNWQDVWRNIKTAMLGFGLYKTGSAIIKMMSVNTVAAAAATREFTRATVQNKAAVAANNPFMEIHTNMLRRIAVWNRKAALSTNLMTVAWNKLKVAMASWGPMAIIAGLSLLINYFISANEKANRLKNTLKEIEQESGIEQMKSVRNFESLANVAVKAADGSKKQKDALDELNRTYKDIIPQERLTIENLRAMKGNYESLTQSIKDYVAEQMKQKQVNAIIESTGQAMLESTRKVQEVMKDTWNYEQIARFMTEYERIIRDNPAITELEAIKKAAENTGNSFEDLLKMGATSRYDFKDALFGFAESLKEQIAQIDALEVAWNNNYSALGRYGDEYEKLVNKIKENPIEVGGSPDIDENKASFLYKQQEQNLEILRAMIPTLQKIMSQAGIVWQDGWANIVETVDTAQPQIISSINFDAINQYLRENLDKLTNEQRTAIYKLQEMYYNIGIPDEVVRHNRKIAIDLANSMSDALSKMGDGTKNALDNVSKYFMASGQSVNDYAKSLDDALESLKARVAELSAIGKLLSPEGRKELEDLKTAVQYVELLRSGISAAVTSSTRSSRGGRKSDNRLSQLNEIEQTLTTINQKYDELLKKEGQTKALADIQEVYGKTLDYINSLGEKFKLNFAMPTDFKTLQDYRKAILNVIETLRMKGYEKAAIELQAKIGTGDVDQLSKQIEEKIKALSDRISRTKTAKEFYDKILSQTGDIDLAMNVTMSVYGDTGEGLFDSIVEQIRQTFSSGNQTIDLQITAELDTAIDTTNQRIDYQKLADIYDKYQDQIIEKNRQTAENIIKEGQKTAAANISTWEKELAKAKDCEQQRTDIINRETQRRAEIYKSNLPQEEKERLAGQSRTKQSEDLAKVNFEEFTKSEDYIKIFENLDNTSTAALKRLREEMQKLIETNKDLSPENMKTLVKAMEDIDEQISGRGFGNDMVQGVRDYIDALRDLKTARAELKASQAEFDAQLPQLDADIETAKAEEIAAQKELNVLKAQELQDVNAIVAAELRLNNATKGVTLAEQAKAKAADKVKKAEAKVTNQQDKQRKATSKFFNDMQQVAQTADQLASVLGEVEELLGVSADSAEGVAFDSAIQGLQEFSKLMNVIIGLQTLYNIVTSSNPWLAIAAAVLAVGSILGNWISNNKVRKANKEIERQQELLDQLQYTYSRLEKAAEKLFGAQYIANYGQQLRVLNAQAQAYRKQAEAERSKGKKADKDKLKEFEDSYRDTMDEIRDMQGGLAEHMMGTDVESAARDFAKAWLDAKLSFENTTDAIREKFADMIKNMIAESVTAQLVQSALQPFFDEIDKMYKSGASMDEVIEYALSRIDPLTNQITDGLEVWYNGMKARGIDLNKILGSTEASYKGIKREVAGATSEEMNANTAALNAQNHYMSQVPGIAANVAVMRQIMERGNASASTTTTAGWTDWQQQAMDHYSAIQRNTAETVVECRRAAQAAEAAVTELRRVIKPKGTNAAYGIQVYM